MVCSSHRPVNVSVRQPGNVQRPGLVFGLWYLGIRVQLIPLFLSFVTSARYATLLSPSFESLAAYRVGHSLYRVADADILA
jgi:hypothetical protein